MVFKRINEIRIQAMDKGSSLLAFGQDVLRESIRLYNDRFGAETDVPEGQVVKDLEASKEAPERFKNPAKNNPKESARQTSLNSHKLKQQVVGEKFDSNMGHRNFNNHQGN